MVAPLSKIIRTPVRYLPLYLAVSVLTALAAIGLMIPEVRADSFSSHAPILIEDIHATAENPYVIEGFDITSTDGNCIEIRNSEHVIIRNNYLHDCQIDRDAIDYGIDVKDIDNDYRGFAILIGDCEDITIESNRLDYNKQGILLYRTQRINIIGNDIRHTIWWRAVALEKCDGAEIAGNSIIDNGVPEWFWAPGKRVLGIWTQQSNVLDIHDNTIIRPSTDGITILGFIYAGSMTSEQDDWSTVAHDVRIYNNTILDVMEIGVALMRVRNAEVFNNTIRQGGMALDPDVRDSEIYNNKILTFKIPNALGMGISHNNHIHDNTHYSIDEDLENIDFVGNLDDLPCQPTKCEWFGIPFQRSSGNLIENNHKVKIGGALAEAIREKKEIAERDAIWEPKGWFGCETAEGVIDEECLAREEAKGNQGIPREWMVFDPLMTDFDTYTIITETQEPAGETLDGYGIHESILLENIHATADNPHVIEGYDISSTDGNCIEIRNCSHIIIRNNYLHDCEINRDAEYYGINLEATDETRGFAVLVIDSEEISIANNSLLYNKQGILACNTRGITINNNDVRHTIWWRSIALEKSENAEISGNTIVDNGVPEWFWTPGKRICGIWTQQSSMLDIHDNTIICSSSDGITVMGTIYAGSMTSPYDDWTTNAHDIDIYNNTILDNMEMGICVIRVHGISVYNNTIREGALTLGGCICFHFDIRDAEVYNNKLTVTLERPPMTILVSHNCHIHDNTHYCHHYYEENTIDSIFVSVSDDEEHLKTKAEWAGIPFTRSSGNTFEHNTMHYIGGDLESAIEEKLELAHHENTFKEKGYWTCETAEGVFDPECVERESAKGIQGVPAEWLVFEPLMDNSEEYVKSSETNSSSPDENPEATSDNRTRIIEILIPVSIGAGVLLLTVVIIVLARRRKYN